MDKTHFQKSVGKHELYLFETFETGREGASAEILSQAQIVYGAPDPAAVLKCRNLRWIHLNTAGYTAYDNENFKPELKRRGTILTNSSAVYVEPCSQHVLAMMMATARLLPISLDNQRSEKAWKYDETRQKSFLLQLKPRKLRVALKQKSACRVFVKRSPSRLG